MKINGPGGPSAAPAARRTSGAAAEGFHLASTPGPAGSAAAARPAGAGGVNSLGALLALQDVEGPTERRRRSLGRAGRLLDRLEELKLSLLEGGATGAGMRALGEAVRDQRALTDEPELEDVLDAIDLRAAVELAKFERTRPSLAA